MKIAANDTALVVTGPQNDVLSETGIAAGLASNSIHAQGGPL